MEPGLVASYREVDHLAGGGHVARGTLPELHANLAQLREMRRAGKHLAPGKVDEP